VTNSMALPIAHRTALATAAVGAWAALKQAKMISVEAMLSLKHAGVEITSMECNCGERLTVMRRPEITEPRLNTRLATQLHAVFCPSGVLRTKRKNGYTLYRCLCCGRFFKLLVSRFNDVYGLEMWDTTETEPLRSIRAYDTVTASLENMLRSRARALRWAMRTEKRRVINDQLKHFLYATETELDTMEAAHIATGAAVDEANAMSAAARAHME